MKSIIKYYLIPIFLLILLNLILFLYVSRFQNNTYNQLRDLDLSNDYLSTVLDTTVELNEYLESGAKADSIQFVDKVDELILETDLFTSAVQTESSLGDSLTNTVDKYSAVLHELAKAGHENPALNDINTVSSRVESHSLLQTIQQIVHQIDEDNSNKTIASLNQSNNLLYVLIVVYILIISGILLVSYYNIIHPLKRLRKEIQKLSHGSYTQIDIDRDDEIGELIDSFNETSLSLKESQEELRHANEKLQLTNKELEAFAYSVSHDLRSPLRSISGFSDALVSNFSDELSPRAQDYLGRVNRAAQKMGNLIDDILKLSRVTRSDVKRVRFDVSALSREVIELLKTEKESNYQFQVEEGITILADEGLTKVILLNLISNAIKFSRKTPQPVIKIGSQLKDKKKYIYVKDNGIGFDMQYAEKIFTAFQRLHPDGEFEGSGIGLATVQRIVNKHGGTIYAESKKGEGTTITFNLGA